MDQRLNRERYGRRRWRLAVMATSIVLAACGGADKTSDTSAAQPSDAPKTKAPAEAGQPDWKPTIKTATLPENPCDLLPVAEVETILGQLAEPPKNDEGCRYILPVPEAVLAKRQQAREARERFGKAFGLPSEPPPSTSIFESQEDPRNYSVTVRVDLNAKPDPESKAEGTTSDANWDEVRRTRSGLNGRIGHIQIVVNRQSSDVPTEPMYTLAERVRERIPDLPFAVTNPYQVVQVNEGDPCSLLTRGEVEAMIGPLAFDPYRSSSEMPPLAHRQGHACAYYAPGHRVFVVAPTWSGGATAFKATKLVGGLIGMVVPEETLVLKGPWDEALVDITSGALMFLKGDRLLEVYYGTSRATRADAIKLAVTALPRLGP